MLAVGMGSRDCPPKDRITPNAMAIGTHKAQGDIYLPPEWDHGIVFRWFFGETVAVSDADPIIAGLPDGSRVFETSGSTGGPVGIVHSVEALRASGAAVNRHLEVDGGSCWALALPRRHVGGCGVVVRAELAGCRLAEWSGRWDPVGFADWLAREGATHTSLVPTQVHDLVRAGCRAPDLLRALVVGGGRLDDVTGQAARDLGWPALASYGLTEAASQVATASLDSLGEPYRSTSLLVLSSWEVRIASGGLIGLLGPALFLGHIGIGDDGARRFVPRQEEWFETRDLGTLDEHGRLSVTGRADQLVKILGELVDPLAIERALESRAPGELHGRIAVVAVPDPRAGHRLVPVREAGVGPAVAQSARDAWHRECPGYARLGEWVAVEKIPCSPLGKVRRTELEKIVCQGG